MLGLSHLPGGKLVASVIRDIVEALHRALKKEAQWKRKNGTGGSGGSSHGNSGGSHGNSGGSYGNSGSSIGGGSYGSAYRGGNYSRGVGHDYTSLSDPIDRSNLLFHLPEEVIVPINWTSDKLNRLVRMPKPLQMAHGIVFAKVSQVKQPLSL